MDGHLPLFALNRHLLAESFFGVEGTCPSRVQGAPGMLVVGCVRWWLTPIASVVGDNWWVVEATRAYSLSCFSTLFRWCLNPVSKV